MNAYRSSDCGELNDFLYFLLLSHHVSHYNCAYSLSNYRQKCVTGMPYRVSVPAVGWFEIALGGKRMEVS